MKKLSNSTWLSCLYPVLMTSFIFLNACYNRKPNIVQVDPEFAKYVSGYTSGTISRRHNIRIELAKPYTTNNGQWWQQDKPDSTALEDIFDFEPSLKGRAVWINSRVIEFIPSEPLPPAQFYTVTFNLEKVAHVKENKFEEFVFQFSSYPQNITVDLYGLVNYDSRNTEWQKLSGKLSTSDYADTAQVRKVLSVLVNGKKAPVKWQFASGNNEFYFQVDSIKRGLEKGKVEVIWDGEPISSLNKGKQVLDISSMGDFTVNDAKVTEEDDQVLELFFTEPLMLNQNLDGIVRLQGVDKPTFSIEGNVLKVYPGTHLEGDKSVQISTGIKSFMGYKMNEAYETSVTFMPPQPKVRLFGNGCILPNSGGLIFPFEAIALKAVDVRVAKIYQNNVHQFLQVNELNGSDQLFRVAKVIAEKKITLDYNKEKNLKQWNTHVLDLAKLISPEPGAIYRVSIRFTKDYAICDCESSEEEESNNGESDGYTSFNTETDNEWNERGWGGYWYSFDDGYESWSYYYGDEYTACDRQYYRGKAVSRNIIASDLGMIYKLDEDKLSHAFISNMITAEPLAGCTIEYFDYARQVIAKGTTDAAGMLDLPIKQKPFLMVASYGKQRGYMKLVDGAANSLSKFDIEGEVVQKGVKGFIYGERGVWRPGDSLYLNFILEDKDKRLPPNHPVSFELLDPDGTMVWHTSKAENKNGLYDFRTATDDGAVTGNYMAIARVGNRSFSRSIKIETVKPNRLKIYFDVNKDIQLTAGNADTIGTVRAQWLHGAIAGNLRANVNVTFNQAETKFDGYPNYIFDSPLRAYYGEATTVFDQALNDHGEAKIKATFPESNSAPGMLRASFVTKVFEEGGDFSIDRFSMQYSPYKTYIGLRIPETKNYNNALETGKVYKFEIASLDQHGKPVNADKVRIKVYRMQWRWWYERDEEDLSDYISRASTEEISDTVLKVSQGKALYNFWKDDGGYGRYLVTVTDEQGGHQTGRIVVVNWPYWSRGNMKNNEHAAMLNFSSNKTTYTTGEKIQLSIPSPANGKALISIETGTRVLRKFWISTVKGETHYEINAEKDMSPNAYVHITLLQPHEGTKNDLPIRMYGVIPVSVDDPASHLQPVIACADVWKPETNAEVVVKESKGKAMTYTLAVVDEGLLDLTRFSTPQPWNTFYAREALGVKTWDMYDAVIGAYAGKIDKLLSIGGDGDGMGAKGVKANRFKPMVRFMGPFTLGAGQQKKHKVEIPNYVGSVRVMVVAEQNGAYGNAEKAVVVKKPLMVLATLPRVLGPSESVYLPVDVFAMEDHVRDVKVEIEVNDMLKISGNSEEKVHFDRNGDQVVSFRLDVAQKTGIARVKVRAVSGKEKASQEIELDVRIANPKVTDVSEFTIEAGKSGSSLLAFKGLQGTNKAIIEVSNMPSIGLEKRLDYLVQYPHGCIEQTTSSVFPQLFVSNLVELKDAQKDRIAKYVKAGLKRLQLFQTSGGGFSYWPGEGYASEWGSNYAGHFMIEAEKQGYSLPNNMKSRWLRYQQQQARNWAENNNSFTHPHGSESYQHIQAYRLYVLALSGNAELGAMNRLRENKDLYAEAKWRLAAAYQLAGQPEVARLLTSGLPTDLPQYRELSYSYGSDVRDEAMILETLSLMKEKTRSAEVAKRVIKMLNSENWMSTQETAYNLLALTQYTGATDPGRGVDFNCMVNSGASLHQETKRSVLQVVYTDKEVKTSDVLKLINNGNSTLYVKVMTEGIPLTDDKSASQSHLNMNIVYKNMKGQVIQPGKIEQGTDFIAEVSITNPGDKGPLKEMALNQIFASGWEIHNARMDGNDNNPSRYQDIRDDRVYTYYDLDEGETKTFTIRLNATYLGRFYLPTIYTEAMYDHTINARQPGMWVEVVKQGKIALK